MMARWSRRWIVVLVSWGMRCGIGPVDMLGLLAEALPRWSSADRLAVVIDAERRNTRRRVAAGG